MGLLSRLRAWSTFILRALHHVNGCFREDNMNDYIRDMEWCWRNVVTLDELLQGANPIFRKAVEEILALESFEMDDQLPNLQHPEVILEAIGNLKGYGFDLDWKSFQLGLEKASKAGILVDLSSFAFEIVDF